MFDIYKKLDIYPELEEKLEAIEKALGFKLFTWQKSFIAYGIFRQYGQTTAEILKDLLDVKAPPIDYARLPKSNMERFYIHELREVKAKLDEAGIETRTVFFNQADKKAFAAAEREKEKRYYTDAKEEPAQRYQRRGWKTWE